MKTLLSLLIFVFLSINAKATTNQSTPTIYGNDDRIEVYQAPPEWQEKADSTVGLFTNTSLIDNGNGQYRVNGGNYGKIYNLCPSERFIEQMTAAFCSGSLIAPNIVMTAGHCLATASNCANTKFVFGYSYKFQDQCLSTVPATEVYSCKQIIAREQNETGADYTIAYLDRPALNHKPLELSNYVVSVGDPVVIIGHPAGIPTKIAANANVRSVQNGFFVANLDDYGGNSGSPVFNAMTGLVEGILVRGDKDFVGQGNCNVSYVNPNDGGRGEDVTRIDAVIAHMPRP